MMSVETLDVSVIGLGYIGLPTALMLASRGIQVHGTDLDARLVSSLTSGQRSFQEEGLSILFDAALRNGVAFSTDYVASNVYIVAVPTPFDGGSKKLDPQYVLKAIGSVLDVCPRGAIIVIESTIAPGTVDRYVRPLIQSRGMVIGRDVHLAHAPERIIPGRMLHELVQNPRTIGVDASVVGESLVGLYSRFCDGELVVTDIRTAEMTKVVENTFRDVNIAFANELARICRSDNMDVLEIIRIANLHPRVNILQPGPGVGGHCISVDPWFLVGDYPGLANIILAARKINDSMPEFVLERCLAVMSEEGMTDVARVGLYGLTYKENVDDVRESPTLQLLEARGRHLAQPLYCYDPYVERDVVVGQVHDLDDFLSRVDVVVIMVAHDEIVSNMSKLSNKIVLDTRNCCTLPGVHRL